MVFGDSTSDEELMRAYQNGADDAFNLLFSRYSARVYGFLMHQLRDRSQADDVFQAAFLKLHQARRHYDPSFPFAPWLFTVCKSVLIDHARKSKRNKEDLNGDLVARIVDQKTVELPSRDLSLDGLPENQRAAIELRYKDELQFEEIAQRLKTSPSNVRKLVSRGIQRLKVLAVKERNEHETE